MNVLLSTMTSARPRRGRVEYGSHERPGLAAVVDLREEAIKSLSPRTAPSPSEVSGGDPKTAAEIAAIVDASIRTVRHRPRRLEKQT